MNQEDRNEFKVRFKLALKEKGLGYTDLMNFSGKSYGHIRNTLSTKRCLPRWVYDFAEEKRLFN